MVGFDFGVTGATNARYRITAFVVAVDDDVRFRKGDILKPAGYNAPARNSPRGNILDGNYPINWTGPLYIN